MHNLIIRTVCQSDLNDLFDLAVSAGPGMTNFPPDKALLQKKIDLSIQSFQTPVSKPGQEYYFFVLEDTEKQQVVGCCGIFATAGGEHPFYSYKVAQEHLVSTDVSINKTINTLYLLHDYHDTSEIATLFLSADYRQDKNGEFLSRSRFLFIKLFIERFCEKVIAEMRGVINSEGRSPFWDSLGAHFFDMDFMAADFLCAMGRKQFIGDVMPRLPVYVPLLTSAAQAVIGEAHEHTKPALALLEKEGFCYEGYVDIFDAGPTVEVRANQIKTVKHSKTYRVARIESITTDSSYMMLSNTSIDYRACRGEVVIDNDSIQLQPETAQALQVDVGSEVQAIEFPLASK